MWMSHSFFRTSSSFSPSLLRLLLFLLLFLSPSSFFLLSFLLPLFSSVFFSFFLFIRLSLSPYLGPCPVVIQPPLSCCLANCRRHSAAIRSPLDRCPANHRHCLAGGERGRRQEGSWLGQGWGFFDHESVLGWLIVW